MYSKINRFIALAVTASILISCSASQHAGVTTIKEPSLSENDQNIWFSYYQDQFDALEGNVMPPGEQYPKSAHQGYEQAKDEWNKKVSRAKGRTTLLYVCGGSALLVSVIYVLSFMSAREIKPAL